MQSLNSANSKHNGGILLIELNCDNGAGRRGHAFILLQSGGKVQANKMPNRTNTKDNANTNTNTKDNANANDTTSLPRLRNKNRTIIPELINTRMFTDGGGRRDACDSSCIHTAVRELREESANLISINPDTIKGTLAIDVNCKYICFVVAVDTPIDLALFEKNRDLLKSQGAPPEWLESASMAKFYLEDLLPGDIATDIHGNKHAISSRARHVLSELYRLRNDPTKSIFGISLEMSVSMNDDFTAGTSTYSNVALSTKEIIDKIEEKYKHSNYIASDATTFTRHCTSDASQNSI